jgi:transcriptional regulator with XRE-family HTH domain
MKKEILIKFGNKVRQERLKRNLSQEDFAEIIGVHRTYIGMIERAEKNITLANIEKIAKALKMPINRLFEFNNS